MSALEPLLLPLPDEDEDGAPLGAGMPGADDPEPLRPDEEGEGMPELPLRPDEPPEEPEEPPDEPLEDDGEELGEEGMEDEDD